ITLVLLRKEKEISSFESFNYEENGIYSDLCNISTDLEYLAKEMGYNSIERNENENIYHFVQDEVWKKRGNIEWRLIVKKDHYNYLVISK
ncbi:DUF6162 family protein, partial [Streptobacillus moniliformis]|uniref:DUF6162 family protein n=1 Tax=Streptobacillus moniliformis TaxID=34105 RepID=UPI000A48F044